MQDKVIIGCSSLKDYIDHAQNKQKTNYPVVLLDRLYHRDPNEMREHVIRALDGQFIVLQKGQKVMR